ncbi:uncharacterized protein Z520_10249 [Fonsecaea multimorphosa CBS 102226]|uniref:Transcription factor domain-containing protein n=1 Tax=Fonsecaea multimorphosa CBS 102226 TaxID=1442371 RepID=A0A0D2JL02_9EURO|nr:uncharacterized protein Z520_10249 [Fonsecaea multimorphosa CBS 102226]KIX93912.1 hypothetical protein Z520_10249 [Fonsecaea multimorphosa CBS 102226]
MALVLRQIQRRSSNEQDRETSSPSATQPQNLSNYPPSNIFPGLVTSDDCSNALGQMGFITHRRTKEVDWHGQLQTCQAILALMVMGTWGTRDVVREILALQSVLAILVREDGLSNLDDDVPPPQHCVHAGDPDRTSWVTWACAESRKRTKLLTYCFFNLQAVAYNITPLITTAEISSVIRKYRGLLSGQLCGSLPTQKRSLKFKSIRVSSRNYILISALLQRIFSLRLSTTGTIPGTNLLDFRPDEIDILSHALQLWQALRKEAPGSSLDPQSPSGPVAFNSSALLRLAWIRFHSDLGPCRSLWSRDPLLIAASFRSCPPLQRSPRLSHAILQAAHALSIPVRLGINFVARTQTFSWSIQHSLCNLKCAILLDRWLGEIVLTLPQHPLTTEEINIINLLRGVIRESDLYVPEIITDSTAIECQQRSIRYLRVAVIPLWAMIYDGIHVFDVVSTIGSSLKVHAQRLEEKQALASE